MSALSAALAALLLAVLGGNITRLPLFAMAGGRSAPLLLVDVALIGVLATGTLVAVRGRRLPLDATFAWGAVFVAWALLGLVTAPVRADIAWSGVPVAGAYLVRWVAYWSVGVLVAAFASRRDATQVLGVLRGAVLGFALFGIVQSALLPGFAQLIYPEAALYLDWDPQGRRLVSTFLDPNFAGAFILLGLCWWGGRLLAGARAPWWEGGVLILAAALTLSRSTALAGIVAAAVLLAARGLSRRALMAVGVTVLVLVVALPLLLWLAPQYGKTGIDASALQRLLSWQRAGTLVWDFPGLGIGFNTLGFVQSRYGWGAVGASAFGLDGGLLFVAALTGIPGGLLMATLLLGVVRTGRTLWRTSADPQVRAVGYAAAASVAGMVIHGLFVNSLLLPLLMAPCWVLWGLPRALQRAEAA